MIQRMIDIRIDHDETQRQLQRFIAAMAEIFAPLLSAIIRCKLHDMKPDIIRRLSRIL